MNGMNWWDADARPHGRRRPGLAATAAVTAAVGALVALALWGQWETNGPAGRFRLDLAVGIVGCALVPVLLRRPVTGGLALTVLAVLSPVGTPLATVAALHVARSSRLRAAAGVAAAGVCAHAAQGLWRPTGGLSYRWWLVLVIAAYAALVGWGVLARARSALLASLCERAHQAEAERDRRVAEARMAERTRIAREMHDVLAHRLSLVATYAGAMQYRPDSSPEKLAHAAGVVRAAAHQALDELREVIDVLRDGDAVDEDAATRPQPTLEDLRELAQESRDAGSPVQVDDQVADSGAVPAGVGRTAYRIVQEGLTNARKHAFGQPVQVSLGGRPGDHLTIDIRNPLPADRDAPPVTGGTGTGLVGLAERVQLAGGHLHHEIVAEEAFRLHARLPWPA